MSYTSSYLHNFIPSPARGITTSSAAMSVDPQNRREVRPLDGSSGNNKSSTTAPPPPPLPHTANLEAQVRTLEQEVHLLRSGLAQNIKMQQSAVPAAPLERRVHFGPSSIIPIPRVTTTGFSSSPSPRCTRKPSTSPSRKPDGRPRLAFGQRVDPSLPRNTPSSTASTVSKHDPRASNAQNAGDVESASPERTAAATVSSSPPPTYVHHSPAPAPPHGSTATAGIPLQGLAAGATVVTPPASLTPSSAAPAATVWASANPSLLWGRSAAAPVTSAATGHREKYDGGDTGLLSAYPFRTSGATSPVAGGATTTTTTVRPVNAVYTSAAPILVTMSSDGLPGGATMKVVSTAPPVSTQPPAAPAAVTEENTTVKVEATPVEVPTSAPAAALSPPNASGSPTPAVDVSVDELKRQVAELRDTLEQREALLHRVLAELHDRGNTSTTTITTGKSPMRRPSAADEREEQSRRTLRLLTQELLAAQTQLSHARVSYGLLQAELQRRPPQEQHQSSPPPPQQQQQQRDLSAAPPQPVAATPADTELQAQLDAALQKVKAWEDWYATTASSNADNDGAATAVVQAGTAPAPAKLAESAANKAVKAAKKKHHHHSSKDAEGGRQVSTPCCCPHCGAHMPEASVRSAATPRVAGGASPLASAYTFDDALYSLFAGNECPTTALFASSGVLQPQPSPPLSRQPQGGAADQAEKVPSSNSAAATPPPLAAPRTSQQPPFRVSAAVPAYAAHTRADTTPTHFTTSWGSGYGGGGAADYAMRERLAPSSMQLSIPSYCDDLEHAKLQAYYNQQFVTQIAREAAVRELAEAERQVAEERLALLRRYEPSSLAPHASLSTAKVPDAASLAALNGAASRETVDEK
jgi:uncharacterized coiled-coil protein SlyX